MGFADTNYMGAIIGDGGSTAGVAVDITIPDGEVRGTKMPNKTGLIDFKPGTPIPYTHIPKQVDPPLQHISGPDYQTREQVAKRMDMRELLIQVKTKSVLEEWGDKIARFNKAKKYVEQYGSQETVSAEVETRLAKARKIVDRGHPMPVAQARKEASKLLGFEK